MSTEEDRGFLEAVVERCRAKDWKSVVALNESSDSDAALKLLWVWPSLENLRFMERSLREAGVSGVTSVGCGCGLFEWILQEATGFAVVGLEVNEEWWASKYSNPKFIDHVYARPEAPAPALDPRSALLFCYFNDGPAFRDYVERYEGELVVIVGPGEGRGTHTDPAPFTADFGQYSRWSLRSFQEVKATRDFIAVYHRLG